MKPAERIIGQRIVLERVATSHVAALRRLHEKPEVRRWWRTPSGQWPLDEADEIGYAVLVDGEPEPRGFVQFYEENDPDYRHAGIDVFLDPGLHGRGYGREVVATLAAYLIDERGHHRLIIDPATENATAIACYAAVGFRPVGVMRHYERGEDGTWHDGLLMDLLPDDLTRPTPLGVDHAIRDDHAIRA